MQIDSVTSTFLVDCQELSPLEISMARQAARHALNSNDETKVGVVVFKEGEILSMGYNHFTNGVTKKDFEITEHNKSKLTIHAEMRSITHASCEGVSIQGSTMVIVGKCPCTDCAKAIVMSGIREVLSPIPDTNSRWSDENELAIRILEAGGVKLRLIKDLAGIEIGLTCHTKYIV